MFKALVQCTRPRRISLLAPRSKVGLPVRRSVCSSVCIS